MSSTKNWKVDESDGDLFEVIMQLWRRGGDSSTLSGELLEGVLRVRPSCGWALLARSNQLLRSDPERAIELARRFVEVDAGPYSYLALGKALLSIGQASEADDALTKARKLAHLDEAIHGTELHDLIEEIECFLD